MIERAGFDGDITFFCEGVFSGGDPCMESVETETTDFHAALDTMKSQGWVNRNVDGTWKHFCKECKHGPRITIADAAPVFSETDIKIIQEVIAETPALPPVVHTITLGAQQAEAAALIMEWYKDDSRQVFVLAGYAGAGKTTLAKYIAAELHNNLTFGAYTGKAVNILREKGCPNVDTIHTLLYKPVSVDKTKLNDLQLELTNLGAGGDAFKSAQLRSEIDAVKKDMRKPRFELNIEAGKGKLIVVDEYSMLPNEIIADLLRRYEKILFMGDPFQLPPVKGECSLNPDFFLTEIHRQALESAIVRISKDIRENQSFGYGDYGDLVFLPASQIPPEIYMTVDQIIVGRNATRNAINQWYRKQKGITSMLPVAGDKMICLKNNKKLGLFNGMICTATGDAQKAQDHHNNYMLKIDQKMIDGTDVVQVWEGDVMGKGEEYDFNDFMMKSLNRFDYANAITCHKSQGSEFKTCLVYNEPVGNDDLMKRRWLYTAITRGKEKVYLVQP